ncbi:spore germination protein [Paenibacillus arenilitoris]|uniref:Spore germination protein n=1 Tax=Paenibacillus arenilitoris TaxID=2772299 RepID=A0A927CQU8_9BACL|nr:spore germination protein [Paenibacillus arenilitoris]MBD2871432.1 spore germination protein [Paenibacillus arenilitoris]
MPFGKGLKKSGTKQTIAVPSRALAEYDDVPLDGDLEKTIAFVEDMIGANADAVIRRFHMFGKYPAAMFYFCNMVNQTSIHSDLLKPLMYPPPHIDADDIGLDRLKDVIMNDALYYTGSKLENKLAALVENVLRGSTVIAVDGIREAIVVETRSIEKRSIDQPATEQVIRGPREGFIEPIGTNIALIRYRLQSADLRIESSEIGRRTKSKVAVCYMEGITNPKLVEEVNKRLSKIDIDGVMDSGYLEQFIEDNHLSPFPQVQYTERPDKIVANLLEGRVAILVDGSPLALVVPTVFSQFYQTVEDYTERFLMMSAIRLARLVALMFSLVFPSIYVSIISFNPELIPTEFAVAVAGGRAGVPFPAVVEVLIIEVSMEVLREATIRLPQQVGGALSIVGVLVIGQAAVAAGFASPITVVIIALTTIGSFATPAYNAALALRLLRFPLIFMAGIFGLYGVMIGLILIANHLLSLKSFGVPYLSPLVPGDFQGMKDLIVRGPLSWMKDRPSFLRPVDKVKTGGGAAHDVVRQSGLSGEQSEGQSGSSERSDQSGQTGQSDPSPKPAADAKREEGG